MGNKEIPVAGSTSFWPLRGTPSLIIKLFKCTRAVFGLWISAVFCHCLKVVALLTVSYLNSCRIFAILFSSPDVLLVNQTFNNLHFFTDMWCLEKPKH